MKAFDRFAIATVAASLATRFGIAFRARASADTAGQPAHRRQWVGWPLMRRVPPDDGTPRGVGR
ncbi:hypothetical protein WS71_31090 [Burkholderia mayonis]|uniref:Uncharacterized protein n=1 Tax=Burkholderia mayonis TaxID=1385591 RepID=A0A1B4G6F8_9BURK|nr:hypothetical protein WS71_31090 [Burkholderia mayonis]KVE46476.1 hypothetical protein WS71_22250 [Burkholderia mayonis]